MSRRGVLFGERAREARAPARNALYADNAELRKRRRTFQAPDVDSGHLAFRISPEDFIKHAFGEVLAYDPVTHKAAIRRARYPDLVAPDEASQVKELRRLLRDYPEYRINPTEGKKLPYDARTAHRIIVK